MVAIQTANNAKRARLISRLGNYIIPIFRKARLFFLRVFQNTELFPFFTVSKIAEVKIPVREATILEIRKRSSFIPGD